MLMDRVKLGSCSNEIWNLVNKKTTNIFEVAVNFFVSFFFLLSLYTHDHPKVKTQIDNREIISFSTAIGGSAVDTSFPDDIPVEWPELRNNLGFWNGDGHRCLVVGPLALAVVRLNINKFPLSLFP